MEFGLTTSNPLMLPEIIGLVIENVDMVPDLLNCACVNRTWIVVALKQLYQGSLSDMQFRTPEIASIDCLFAASRERFRQNMSFVKHLLLSTDTPGHDQYVRPDIKRVCLETCRVLRLRKYAKSLLGLQRTSLASLIIPFDIPNQNWGAISNLLLASSVEFLAIHAKYCQLFLNLPAKKLSNLKALTIYRSKIAQEVGKMCQLLEICNLRFFYIEQTSRHAMWSADDIAMLIKYLQQQQNLEALALKITFTALPNTGLLSEGPGSAGTLWPRLKALYLQLADEEWLELLPKFKELQILQVHELVSASQSSYSSTNRSAIKNITRCRNLRILDIGMEEFNDVAALSDIARGCPLLRKLAFRTTTNGKVDDATLFDSISALPHLEIIILNLCCRVSGARLLNLARQCPRLTVLNLSNVQLYISFVQLTEAVTFKHLEIIQLSEIWFEEPHLMLRHDRFKNILTQWRRVFPKLRETPCPADSCTEYLEDDYLSDGPDIDSDPDTSDESYIDDDSDMGVLSEDSTEVLHAQAMALAEHERSLNEASKNMTSQIFDIDTYIGRRLQFKSRVQLWRALGLMKFGQIEERVQNIWQSNTEIEIIGWPVLLARRFYAPDRYSSTTKGLL